MVTLPHRFINNNNNNNRGFDRVSVKVVTQHSKTCLFVFFLWFLIIMDATMKSCFSYWSKRRRVHNNVADNFATVLSSPDGLVEVRGIVEVILFELLVKSNSYI